MRGFPFLPLALGSLVAACASAPDSGPSLRALVTGTPLYGIHGLDFDAEGRLFVGSVIGESIYEIDLESGAARTVVAPPLGTADDLAFGPPGTPLADWMVWTHIRKGELWGRSPQGKLMRLATNLPAANSLAFADDGRLFVSQTYGPDRIVEVDLAGGTEHREIARGVGSLHGFDVGPDGALYGPLWFRGLVIRLDPDSGEQRPVAEGFGLPAAANFDSRGRLYVADTQRGEIVRVDLGSGRREVVARLPTAIDNLAVSADDRLYVTVMADNAIHRVDPESGETAILTQSPLAVASDIAFAREGQRRYLYVADFMKVVRIDVDSAKIEPLLRVLTGTFVFPSHLDVSPDGIALSSSFLGAVEVFDRAARTRRFVAHALDSPQELLLEPDGSVLVLEAGSGRLLRIWGPGERQRLIVARGLDAPCGMVRDGDGHVIVSETGSGEISRISLGSGARRTLARGLDHPEGLVWDRDGSLLIAEAGNGRIRALARDGSLRVLVANVPMGYLSDQRRGPGPVPTGLAVADDGEVFVSADREAAIYRLTP